MGQQRPKARLIVGLLDHQKHQVIDPFHLLRQQCTDRDSQLCTANNAGPFFVECIHLGRIGVD